MSPITEAMKPSRNSDRQSCASSGELLPKNGTAFATESPTTVVSSRPTSFGSSRRAGKLQKIIASRGARAHRNAAVCASISLTWILPNACASTRQAMRARCGQARADRPRKLLRVICYDRLVNLRPPSDPIDLVLPIDVRNRHRAPPARALPSARRRRAVWHRTRSGRAQDGRLVRPLQHHVQLPDQPRHHAERGLDGGGGAVV